MEEDKCKKCGRTYEEVELEPMPCCSSYLCWDYCLYEEPERCPICNTRIKVISKDGMTGEARVESICFGVPSEMSQEEFDRNLAEIMDESPASYLLTIPGVYEVVSEHFNNDVLGKWEREKREEEEGGVKE